MLGPVLGGVRIDVHPADRVLGEVSRAGLRCGGASMVVNGMWLAHQGLLLLTSREPLGGILKALTYTPAGYMSIMQIETKTAVLKRLKRIEGQVRGLAGMVEDDRYCIDVVTQISAVRAALRRVEEEILRDHVAHCVEHAIASGDRDDQRQKIAEIMDVLARADR